MSYHVRVKICGITNEADGRQAGYLGADAIGLNFAAESPRRIDFATAKFVLRELPPFIEAVGVFVNRPLQKAFHDAHQVGRINTIQWHGQSQNRELCDPYPFQLIQAFQVRDKDSLLEIKRYLDVCRDLGQTPSALLLDGHSPSQLGGTGKKAPWGVLAEFRPAIPIILAGGLTPENVGEAVRVVRPYAVDVASGVERTVGHKDPELVRRFLGNAREAAAAMR
jgi:phosphoribosylanthranilate isomerase